MDPGHDAVQIDGVGQQPTLEGARKCRDNHSEKFGVVGRTGVDHRHAALLPSAPDVEGGKDPSPPTDEASSQPREGRQKWNYLRSRGGRERDPLPLPVDDEGEDVDFLGVGEPLGGRDVHLSGAMDADGFDVGGGIVGDGAVGGDCRADVGVGEKVQDGPPQGWGKALGGGDFCDGVIVIIRYG